MSVRREVVTLSQLLRRNENSYDALFPSLYSSCSAEACDPRSSRRGAGHAPPLPLQTSSRRARAPLPAAGVDAGGRQTSSTPYTERPTTSRYQPLSFTQRVRDASRVSASQSDAAVSSQTSTGPRELSQEVYMGESEQLSAMTSMSQSSFSQTQSQNLLGSSQDDQLQRLQQWQAQQAPPPPAPTSPVRCNNNKQLQELENNLTQAIVEQTCEQRQQQRDLLAQFMNPVKESVEEIKTKLTADTEDQKQQRVAIGELAKDVSDVAASVADLQQQNLNSKAICEEACKSATNEAAAVKAALTELQARVGTVEGSVQSCSEMILLLREGEETKHEGLLSAVAAASCKCPKAVAPPVEYSAADQGNRKRRRSSQRYGTAEKTTVFSASAVESPLNTRTRSHPRYELHDSDSEDQDGTTTSHDGLHHALHRIQALRAKRRNYQRDF